MLAATLLLSGCGGADGPLKSVDVTSNGANKAPKVEFETPLKLENSAVRKLSEGDGAEIDPGQTLSIRMSAFNAKDGSSTAETYTADSGDDLAVNDQMKKANSPLYKALKDARVGSQFAYAVPPVKGGQGSPDRPGQLLVFTVEGKTKPPLEKAKGKSVKPVEGLPTVKVNDSGAPEITIDKSDEKPGELVAQNLIKGSGKVVKKSDTITAHYVGVQWSNGEKFDSSWDRGKPSEFPLDGVVKGWTQGLSGQTVGSRVLLVIPPELGYGKNPGSGQPGGTLVFVVDILGIK